MKITIISHRNDFVLYATKSLNLGAKTEYTSNTLEEFKSSTTINADIILADEQLGLKNLSDVLYNTMLKSSNYKSLITKIIVRCEPFNPGTSKLLELGYDQIIDLHSIQTLTEEDFISFANELENSAIKEIENDEVTLEEEKIIENIFHKYNLDLILVGAKHIVTLLSQCYRNPNLLNKLGIDNIINHISETKSLRVERVTKSINNAIETSYYYSSKDFYKKTFLKDSIPNAYEFITALTYQMLVKQKAKEVL